MKIMKLNKDSKLDFFLTLFLLIIYCKSPTIYKNFSDYKPIEEIAMVEMEGYLLRLQYDPNPNFYDKLYLLEGEYLIEFKDRINFTKGAAYCKLKENKIYTINIVDIKNFPKYKKSVYVGECIEIPKKEEGFLEKFLLEKKLQEEGKESK